MPEARRNMQGIELFNRLSVFLRKYGFDFFVILYFANTFVHLFNKPAIAGLEVDPERGTSPLYTASFGLMHIIGLIYALKHSRITVPMVRARPLIFMVVLVGLVSVLWSLDPAISARRSLALLGTASVGVMLMLRLNPRDILRLLTYTAIIYAFASVALVVLIPRYGLGDAAYASAWRGLSSQKNGLGWMMVFGSICIYFSHRLKLLSTPVAAVSFLTCFVCLVMARSATSYLAFTLAVMTVVFLSQLVASSPRLRPLILVTYVALAGLLLLLWPVVTEGILGVVGKDPTLTGRTAIWERIIGVIKERPLLGYGYRAYWSSDEARGTMTVSGFFAGHSHNGYLDMALDLGGLGIGLYLLALVSALVHLFRRACLGDVLARFYFTSLIICSFIGFSAPVVFRPNTLYMVVVLLGILHGTVAWRRVDQAAPSEPRSPTLPGAARATPVLGGAGGPA